MLENKLDKPFSAFLNMHLIVTGENKDVHSMPMTRDECFQLRAFNSLTVSYKAEQE